MFPFRAITDADLDDAVFVNAQTMSPSSSSPALSSLGAAAGDILIVLSNPSGSGPAVAGGGAFSTLTSTAPSMGVVYWKKLVSADIAGAVSIASGNNIQWKLMIVRGANSLASVRTISGNFASNTAAGVTQAANHAGFIGLVTFNNEGSTATIGGFTLITGNAGPLSTYTGYLLYRLAPPAAPYINGTSFTYGSTGANASNTYLMVMELLR